MYQQKSNTLVYQKPPGYDYSLDNKIDFYKENDNVYLNVVIQNTGINDTTGTTNDADIVAEYNVTKTLPILDKCSQYYCSIIRFDIPLQSVPLFIMPIIPASSFINPQPNPNLSPLIIGIDYLGVDYPVNVLYIADNNLPVPTQNLVGQQVITEYYYGYTYEQLITMINTALITAINNSNINIPAGTEYPYFYLNSSTQLISLIVPNLFVDQTNPGTPTIFVNATLYNYLETFRVFYYGFNQLNGKDYSFILKDTNYPTYNQASDVSGNSVVVVPPAVPAYWKYTQEYSVLNYWTSLKKIIIATNTIPISNEFVPAKNGSGVSNSFPIITDFVPTLEFAGQTRSTAYYYPTSQYRLVDMISDTPLYKINLKIYWEDRDGNLYPIFIPVGQQINIKIGFFRKSLYKPFNQLLYK